MAVTGPGDARFGVEYAAQKSEAVKRYTGTAGTRKPHTADVDPRSPGGNNYTIPDGSTFTEEDTGLVWVWKHSKWNVQLREDRQLEVQEQMLAELTKLREATEFLVSIVMQ